MTDAQKIIALRAELTEQSFRYYVLNDATLVDAEYDAKFQELQALEKEHPEMADPNSPTMRVGAPVPTGMHKVKHKVRMLSLQNVNSLDETESFFKAVTGQPVTIDMKIDGLSLHLSYVDGKLVQALTRGDGSEGADVTENARTIHTIPLLLRKPVTIDVRGEVYWRLSDFKTYNEALPEEDQISNPRNGASGSMLLKDSKQTARRKLSFVAYNCPTYDLPETVKTQEVMLEYLERLGFQTTMTLPVTTNMYGLPYVICNATREELASAITYLDDYRKSLDLDTDGLVIKVSDLALQRDLGEDTRYPNWAAAYKFPAEVKETRLTAITMQVGKTGQITPVAQFDPITLGGAVVRKASICNQDELDRLGIDIGDYVNVQRSAEVIPKIVSLARPSPTKTNLNQSFQIPRNCPCCAEPIQKREVKVQDEASEGGVHLYCVNPQCHDQLFARLVFALGKDALDVDGCGEVTVRALMDRGGARALSDVFAMTEFKFLKGAVLQKLKDGLKTAKDAPLWRKFMALSIGGIGKEKCQLLATRFSSPEIISAYAQDALGSEGDFVDSHKGSPADYQKELAKVSKSYNALSGMSLFPEEVQKLVKETAANSIYDYLIANIDEIEKLDNLGFRFKPDETAGGGGALSGKTFCITGALMSGRRDEVSAVIEKHGGVVKGTVTRHVNYLVQGAGGGNSKAAGAAKHGTQIISEEVLYQMLGLPMPLVTHGGAPESIEP